MHNMHKKCTLTVKPSMFVTFQSVSFYFLQLNMYHFLTRIILHTLFAKPREVFHAQPSLILIMATKFHCDLSKTICLSQTPVS